MGDLIGVMNAGGVLHERAMNFPDTFRARNRPRAATHASAA